MCTRMLARNYLVLDGGRLAHAPDIQILSKKQMKASHGVQLNQTTVLEVHVEVVQAVNTRFSVRLANWHWRRWGR